MLEAMMKAEVGDDVFGEDPTVNKLQQKIADLFGKEAALFVPSGVMGNQVCIKTHTNAGEEIIVEQDAHIFVYENAGPAALSGVSIRTLLGYRGVITAEQVKQAIRPSAYYLPKTRLVCLENTHGRAGGTVFPIEEMRRIREVALESRIMMHLDGARVWNAAVATGISPRAYGELFDSISVCLSKGLGAPIGSVILGTSEFIERARVYRKMFGGGMRQAGILAAAGIYAIDNNIDRLSDDHARARRFAEGIRHLPFFEVDLETVQTNMVIAEIRKGRATQQRVLDLLQSRGVLLTPERVNSIRAVMHLDISEEDVEKAIDVFHSLFSQGSPT